MTLVTDASAAPISDESGRIEQDLGSAGRMASR